MDAADDPAAGRSARHLLHLGFAIHGEQRHAERKGGGDLGLFLDGVAVGDTVRGSAGGEHIVRLGERGDVEAAAQADEQLEDFRRRIGLHRIEHFGVRQRLGEVQIVLTDDVEIDDEARSVVGARFKKFADACGHLHKAPYPAGGVATEVNLLRRAPFRTIADALTSLR